MVPLIGQTEWEGYVLPFAVTVASAIFLRLLFRNDANKGVHGLSIGFGFIAAYFALFGAFAWPPVVAPDYLTALALFAMLVGATLDQLAISKPVRLGMVLVMPIVAVFWTASAESLLMGGGWLFSAGLMGVFGLIVFRRLDEMRKDSLVSAITLFSATLGLTIIAEFYGTRLALFAGALAAALFGYLLIQFFRKTAPLGLSMMLVGGSLYLGLATNLFFMRSQLALPVAMTALPFFVPWMLQIILPREQNHAVAWLLAGEIGVIAALTYAANLYI